jgi:hypothetical protein
MWRTWGQPTGRAYRLAARSVRHRRRLAGLSRDPRPRWRPSTTVAVVGVGGQRVSDSTQLIGLLAAHRASDAVPMTVMRGKRSLHLRVAVAAGPAPAA